MEENNNKTQNQAIVIIGLIVLMLCPWLEEFWIDVITVVCGVFMLIAFVDYVRAYYGRNKKLHDVEGEI